MATRAPKALAKKVPKKDPRISHVTAETRDTLLALGMEPEAIDYYRTTDQEQPTLSQTVPSTYAAYIRSLPHTGLADNLSTHRARMAEWIASAFHVRAAEADCNLDCHTCPSAQLLICTAYNDGAARLDGYTLNAANPLEST